jgi:hypothetical protein
MKFFQEIQQKANENNSRDKSDFKKQELQHELGHERNNIAININGKTWKVVPCRGYADSKEEWSHLNNMKSWAEKKSASTGKKWTVSLTGAPVSETVKSEVQQTVTENEDSPVLGAIIHRIMVGRTDLLAKYGPKLILAAAEDVADFAGDVEEIGSSDVSGWVKQVEKMLEENPPEAFGEASEGPGMYYSEELARKVFAQNPNLDATGKADAVLDAGWPFAVADLGKKSAQYKFVYDEDFPSDFVSAYYELQNQGVKEAAGKRPVAPDPQNYDSDWDYYNDQDEDEMKDDDVDYENMIDEASLAAMRDYFSRPDGNTVAVDREYGAPERKQPANVPPEIQALINKMYRVGKITPQEFEILKRFQAKTGMKVGIKEKDMSTGNQGYDSMLAVMKAVDAGQDATFDLGGEPVTLEYPEARFLAGKYKAFLKAGRQEEFLKYMENPMMFDRLMKQLRDLIDKQKNFKGSVQGERGVEEGKLNEDLQADSGEYYEDSADFFGQFEADHFDEEKESDDGMEIHGYIDGKLVMAWRFDDESMTGGYGAYDDSELSEGWKDKLAAAALAGTMALGAAGAQARVSPGDDPSINRLTGKPVATQMATGDQKPAVQAPKGFSKEYLQAVIDGKHPRPMVSVEKAQELLKQMGESIDKGLTKTNEGYYWCSLDKKSKLIPEGYKKLPSGYITRK